MTTALLLLIGILAILAIIAANGYFVAQEFAYMSVDRTRLAAAAKGGDAAAERALAVTRRTSFMLSGAQLGITVTGLLVGYVAEPLVGQAIGDILGGAGVPAALSISIGTIGALALATVIQMIFGELYPKNLAIANAEPMAKGMARSTTIYLTVFGWLIAFFDWSANALLRLVRIEPVHDVDSTATAEDLERIVADSHASGDLPEELSTLIDRVLDFPRRDVEHAMVPRARVDSVDAGTTVGEVRRLMSEAHSRYPVLVDDHPEGVVELTALLRAGASDGDLVEDHMTPALVLPTLMGLPDALDEMTGHRTQLACVVNEYGGFAGILTLEDLAEELVGEITDEHDDGPAPGVTPGAEGEWTIAGGLHVDELERAIGRDLPESDVETVAGLVIEQRGDLPEVGEVVRVELPNDPREVAEDAVVRRALDIETLTIDRHVPAQVRVTLVESPDEAREDEGGEA